MCFSFLTCSWGYLRRFVKPVNPKDWDWKMDFLDFLGWGDGSGPRLVWSSCLAFSIQKSPQKNDSRLVIITLTIHDYDWFCSLINVPRWRHTIRSPTIRNRDSRFRFSLFFPSGSKHLHFLTSDSDSSSKTVYIASWACLESQV